MNQFLKKSSCDALEELAMGVLRWMISYNRSSVECCCVGKALEIASKTFGFFIGEKRTSMGYLRSDLITERKPVIKL